MAKILFKPIGKNITINNKEVEKYFPRNTQCNIIFRALEITKTEFNIKIKVRGGGFMSQIQAIKLGIAKAIFKYNKNYKYILSCEKLISCDSRKVERKKIGKHKSRKGKQFSKR